MRSAASQGAQICYQDAIGLAVLRIAVAVLGYGAQETDAHGMARLQALLLCMLAAPGQLERAGFLDHATAARGAQPERRADPDGHPLLVQPEAAWWAADVMNADRRWTTWGRRVTEPLRGRTGVVGGVARLWIEWGLGADIQGTHRALVAQTADIAERIERKGRYCSAEDVLPTLHVAVSEGASTELLTRICEGGVLRLNERVVRDRIAASLPAVEARGELQQDDDAEDRADTRKMTDQVSLPAAVAAVAAVRDVREIRDLLETIQVERQALRVRTDARAVRGVRQNLVALLLNEKSQVQVAEEWDCTVSRVSEALEVEWQAVQQDRRWQAFVA